MTTDFVMPLEQMSNAVPLVQRQSLERRVKWALANGWKFLGLWDDSSAAIEGDDNAPIPPDEIDLVGVSPGSPYVQFVPMEVSDSQTS